jgi:hypothetical protein
MLRILWLFALLLLTSLLQAQNAGSLTPATAAPAGAGTPSAEQANTHGAASPNGIANTVTSFTRSPGTYNQTGYFFTVAQTYPSFLAGAARSGYEEPQGYPFGASASANCGSLSATGDNDTCGFTWPINTEFLDPRSGTLYFSYNNPVNRFGGQGVTQPLNYPGNENSDAGSAETHIADYDTDYGDGQLNPFQNIAHQFAGGHNGNYGSGWQKTNTSVSQDKGVWFSQGQHAIRPQVEYCEGLGDCMGSPLHMVFASGLSAPSDEGIHRGDQWIAEDSLVFQGTCATGCTTGSTALVATPTQDKGHLGEGRMAIDLTKASCGASGSGGTLSGSGANQVCSGNRITGQTGASVNVPIAFTAPAGTFTPSTAKGNITAAITAATGQGMPGQSGSGTAYTIGVSNAGHFTAGIACISDLNYGTGSSTFEMVNISSVSPPNITAIFREPHPSGALLMQGGTCGWGLAVNADTITRSTSVTNPHTIRVLLPLVGSPDSATTYVNTFIGGLYFGEGSAWNYHTMPAAGATYSGGTVTVHANFGLLEGFPPAGTGSWGNINGQTVTIADPSHPLDPAYNGSFTVTVIDASDFSYTPGSAPTSGPAATVSATVCNCSFTMYPRAEVTGVYNQKTKQVDGTLALEPNNVAWKKGDTIEVPHWHQPEVNDNHDYIVTFTPQAEVWGRGYQYAGMVSGDLRGFDLKNVGALGQYLGYGGWHKPPLAAMYMEGLWNYSYWINNAPNEALFKVGCKASTPGTHDGCTRFDAAYHVFELINSTGAYGFLDFDPNKNQFEFKNSHPCYTTIGNSIATIGSTSYGGVSIGSRSTNCVLTTPGMQLNGGALLTGESGTGAKIVTNMSPVLGSATLNGATVPAGETLTIAGTLNITGKCVGCVNGPAPESSRSGAALPKIAAGAGAGNSPAVTIANATDSKGEITVVAGTAPNASSSIATVTFGAVSRGGKPSCVVSPANPAALGMAYFPFAGTTSFSINSGERTLTAGTTYEWTYLCAN